MHRLDGFKALARPMKVLQVFKDTEVTDEMLDAAAKLFSEHYGVWNDMAATRMKRRIEAGSRVRASREKLREIYLPKNSTYVRATINDVLVGQAFISRWHIANMKVCWVTQLVVHKDHRERGLATELLSAAKREGDDAYGIMSSQPAACLAAMRGLGHLQDISRISFDFIQKNASSIIEASPVAYVREARLRGTVFGDDGRLTCGADTAFYVDHREPDQALARIKTKMAWPLGDLPEGHEFLVILPVGKDSHA